MSKEDQPKYAKGDELAIVDGKSDIGVRGTIFWSGANKYGPGFRYGLKDEDGETYWVDEANLGTPEGAPAPAPKPPREAKPALEKGSYVEITGGKEGKGEKGEVFWVGDSKFGKGLRYGIRNDGGTTFWVDEDFVTLLNAPAKKPKEAGAAPSNAGNEFSDNFSDNEFSDDFSDDAPIGAPPPDDDAPFDDDDVRIDDDGFDDTPF